VSCRIRRSLPLVAALALLPGRAPLVSQTTADAALTASATRHSYTGGSDATAISLTTGMQLLRSWQSLLASGTWSRFGDGAWSLHGRLDASVFLGQWAGLRPEVAPFASGTRHQDGGGTGHLGGAMRLHLVRGRWGVWIGGEGGRAWNGLDWRTSRLAETGAWAGVGAGTATVRVSVAEVAPAEEFGNAEIGYRLDRGRLELGAYAGGRLQLAAGAGAAAAWAGANAGWWLTDRIAVTAGGGSYPADPAEGLPRAAFVTLGARIASGRTEPALRTYDPQGLRRRSPARGPALEARRDGDEAILTLRGVRASQVELMGDLTAWLPVAFQGRDGRWTLRLRAAPGVYRVNIRRDGGEWTVPPATTTAADEFGGAVGVIVID
jgi:hypothetical protein